MRLLALFLVSIAAWAACPANSLSTPYTYACFVSLSGNDTTGDGSAGSPYRTGDKALTTAAATAGTAIYFRGGRWTTQADVLFHSSDHYSCTETARCYYGGYPGEVFIIDGDGWASAGSASVYVSDDPGTSGATPPYSNHSTPLNYWTFGNTRIEHSSRQIFWLQGSHTGIRFQNVHIDGSMGPQLGSCDGCSIDGVTVKIEGTSTPNGGSQSHAWNCTPSTPSTLQVPWPDSSYAASGSTGVGNSPNYWQLNNVTPLFPDYGSRGCDNFRVDAVYMSKTAPTGDDVFGVEIGRNILVQNTRIRAPKYAPSTTDSLDFKAYNLRYRNVISEWGKNGVKAWGGTYMNGVLATQNLVSSSESAITFGGSFGTSASSYPANVNYNPIRYAGNDTDGDAFIVIGPGVYGNSPTQGQRILIQGVPGCTSINKIVRIHPTKATFNGKHLSFSLQNTDGTQLSCNDSYDFASDTFQEHSSAVTFTGGGSANIVFSSAMPSTGTWTYPSTKLNISMTCTSTGTLPAEITSGTRYYIKTNSSNTTFTITATPQAGTGGTAAITFSGSGTGTHTCVIRDDYNSNGGGKMYVPYTDATAMSEDWGAAILNSTAISQDSTAMTIGYNMDEAAYSGNSFTYDFQGVVAYSPRIKTVVVARMFFGGPRAIVNTTNDYIYVPYYDTGTMQDNDRVSFRCSSNPEQQGIPAPLTVGTEYYIVNTDPGGSRFQISSTSGGAAINLTSAGTGRCWCILPGLSTPYVELDGLTGISVSDTFKIDTLSDGSQPPYPLDESTTYTVSTTSTATPNGTSVYLMTFNTGGADIEHTTYMPGVHYYVEDTARSSGGAAIRGGYTVRSGTTGNNLYYTDNGSPHAQLLEGDSGFPGAITTTAQLQALEGSTSCISDPALNVETGRLTSSSPTCAQNKGYYAAFHEALSVADTTAVIRNKWPVSCAAETCTVEVDNNSDFSSVTETTNITSAGSWQTVIVGKSTPLTASTTYYYRLTQGYDVFTGSFTTSAALSSTATVTRGIGTPADAAHTHARLDVSTDGSSWTTGTNTSCASGCTLTSAAIAKGSQYVRVVRTNSGGTVLATGAAETVLVQ